MSSNIAPSFAIRTRGILDEYLKKIPIHSTTGIAFDIIQKLSGLSQPKPLDEKAAAQNEPPQIQVFAFEQPRTLSLFGVSFKESLLLTTAAQTIITYIVLQTLSTASLYINGTAGVIKSIYAFTYRGDEAGKGCALLEQGLYQLLTAVYDYAVGQFGLICGLFALMHGAFPKTALKIHLLIFRPYFSEPPVIQHLPGELPVEQNFPLLQWIADVLQEILLPFPSPAQGQANVKAQDSPVRKSIQQERTEELIRSRSRPGALNMVAQNE